MKPFDYNKYIKNNPLLKEIFMGPNTDVYEEAQNILDDILSERDWMEIADMTIEDALDTVEAYGHSGPKAQAIAEKLVALVLGGGTPTRQMTGDANADFMGEGFNPIKRMKDFAGEKGWTFSARRPTPEEDVIGREYMRSQGKELGSIGVDRITGNINVMEPNGDFRAVLSSDGEELSAWEMDIHENAFDDEEGSGYSYEYQEGPGASPQEIARAIKQFQSDKFTWEKLAKNDYYAMAQGNAADIKSEYYPNWKMSDFKQVINAIEGGSSSLNEAAEKDIEIDIDSAEQITLKGKELDSDKLGTNKKYRDIILKAPDKAFIYKGKPVSITAVDLNDGSVDEPKIYLTVINEAIGQDNEFSNAALDLVKIAEPMVKGQGYIDNLNPEKRQARKITNADQLSDFYYELRDTLRGTAKDSAKFPMRAKKIIVDKYKIEMTNEYGGEMTWR